MRRLLPSSLHIGLSMQGLALVRVDRSWRGSSSSILADARLAENGANGLAMAFDALAAELCVALKSAACTRMRAHVVLADDLVRYFMVTPPKNTGSLRDCQAAAQMRFQSLYGESLANWQLEADWHASEPFLACAIPANLTSMLQTILGEQRIRLAEVRPQFIAAWNRWHASIRSDAWFGAVYGCSVIVGVIHEGRLVAVRRLSSSYDGGLTASWLHDILAREALLLNLPMPKRFQFAGTPLDTSASESSDSLVFERLDHVQETMTQGIAAPVFLARTGIRA